MSDRPTYSELEAARAVAERLAQEAAADRKAAAADRQKAEYAWGQSEFHNREASAKIATVVERERHLKEDLHEDALLARERAAVEKLKQAQELMADYNNAKHAAAIYLRQCSEREAAARQVAS